MLPDQAEMLSSRAPARSVGQSRVKGAGLVAATVRLTLIDIGVGCAAVMAMKPSASLGHSSGNRVLKTFQDVDAVF
jgi:hypothetical protein